MKKKKFTPAEVRFIRAYPRHRGSGTELCKRFNANKNTISNIRNDSRYYQGKEYQPTEEDAKLVAEAMGSRQP